jgi:hypothetical protein
VGAVPVHAGFAVALTLREKLLNDAVLVAYAGGTFPRTLDTSQFPGGELPDGPPRANLNVFLGPPTINCHANNTLTIALQMWGQLSVTMNAVEEGATVDARLVVRILPTFVVAGSDLQLSPEPSNVTVSQWDFTVIPPGGFSPPANAYLRSPAFRNRLQTAIRAAIAFGVVSLPRIDISFLGPVVSAVEMTAASRVRQGAVMIGLNIQSDELTLVGNAEGLSDFANNNDLAAVTHAAAVPKLLQEVRTQVSQKVSENGAALERLTIAPGAGRFLVSGKASKTIGSATFSFALVPTHYATRPGKTFQYLPKPRHVNSRTWPALGFAVADVSVDTDPAAWIVVVGAVATVLHLGVPFLIVLMVSSMAGQLTGSIAGSDTEAPPPRGAPPPAELGREGRRCASKSRISRSPRKGIALHRSELCDYCFYGGPAGMRPAL